MSRASRAYQLAMRLSLRKPHPPSFSHGENNDYIYFRIFPEGRDEPGRQVYIVDRLSPEKIVEVLVVPTKHLEIPRASLKLTSAQSMEWEIEHIYRGFTIRYTNYWDFILSYIFGRAWWLALRDRLSQWRFDQVAPNLRRDRDILQKLIDIRVAAGDDGLRFAPRGIGTVELMGKMYGQRIYAHPNYARLAAHLNLAIEAFVESGEVKRANGGYFYASGRALSTLSRIEETEIRHRDQVFLHRWMVILTFGLVVVGLLQLVPFQG